MPLGLQVKRMSDPAPPVVTQHLQQNTLGAFLFLLRPLSLCLSFFFFSFFSFFSFSLVCMAYRYVTTVTIGNLQGVTAGDAGSHLDRTGRLVVVFWLRWGLFTFFLLFGGLFTFSLFVRGLFTFLLFFFLWGVF